MKYFGIIKNLCYNKLHAFSFIILCPLFEDLYFEKCFLLFLLFGWCLLLLLELIFACMVILNRLSWLLRAIRNRHILK